MDYITSYQICAHWLPPLINDDYSGLSEGEQQMLLRWIQGQGLPPGHWSCEALEPEFFGLDEVSGLRGTVTRVYYVRVPGLRPSSRRTVDISL